MNSYFFIFEVEPQLENPLIAHVSRAVAHIWSLSADIGDARGIALRFLESEKWQVTEEKEAYLPTAEQIAGLTAEEASQYQAAQSEGISVKYYYWHRSE